MVTKRISVFSNTDRRHFVFLYFSNIMGCNDDENQNNHTKSNDTTKNKNSVTINPPEVSVTNFGNFTLLRSIVP